VYFLSRGIVAIVAGERQVATLHLFTARTAPSGHTTSTSPYVLHPLTCYTPLHPYQVATLTNGDCFGEIALLVPGLRRTASIVALTFCEAQELYDYIPYD
jgi:CRP-like cAMP-binding protein